MIFHLLGFFVRESDFFWGGGFTQGYILGRLFVIMQ